MKQPLSIEELCKVPLIIQYDIDEKGEKIVYSSNATGIPQLYLQSTETGSKAVRITDGADAVMLFTTSKNGDNLIYLQDKDSNEMNCLYLYSLKNGTTTQLTEKGYRFTGYGWHPDGKEFARAYITQKGYVVDIINVESGEITPFIEPPHLYTGAEYSHDGKWIAFISVPSFTNTQIDVVNRNDPEDIITFTVKEDSRSSTPTWSPNDKLIAFRSDASGRNQIYVQKFQGDDQFTLEIADDEEASVYFPIWNPNSDIIYYAVNKYARTTVHAHPITGVKSAAFPFPKGGVGIPKITKDGKTIFALHSSMSSPYGIYKHTIGTDSVVPITPRKFNVDLTSLVTPQSIWYKSFDGRSIHSWYIPGIDSDKASPAVVEVHGGPWDQVSDAWWVTVLAHCLSQQGIAWFAPNFRGSTGYGKEFQDLDIGDPGGGDLEDVMHGVEWLRARPEIDTNQIAIEGGSYGGFLTLMALGKKPDAFTTGVSYVPVTDWKEMYELSDPMFQQFTKTILKGTPKENAELYKKLSPITHVSNIKKPLMIMAGKNDSRCPFVCVEKYVEKLKEHNIPYEFVIQEDTGHQSTVLNKEVQITFYTQIVEYLKKKLDLNTCIGSPK